MSLFKEADVDMIIQSMPNLQMLNNIPVEEETDRESNAKPVEC
jgi:hypothetical protein